MSGLAGARTAIVEALRTLPGLAVHGHVPDSVNEFPAVLVRLSAVSYDEPAFTFRLLLLVAGWQEDEAELALDQYLETSGDHSIRAALDAGPGGVTLLAHSIGRHRVGGLPYMGAELTVTVQPAS